MPLAVHFYQPADYSKGLKRPEISQPSGFSGRYIHTDKNEMKMIIMGVHKVQISRDKCIGCGMCQRDCYAYHIAVENKKATVKTQSCIMCGPCIAVYPKAAVSMTGFNEFPIEIEQPTVLDLLQLLEAIRTRRTILQYKDKSVEPDVIAQIIEAGRLKPSGGNAQDVSCIVLRKEIDRYEKNRGAHCKKGKDSDMYG